MLFNKTYNILDIKGYTTSVCCPAVNSSSKNNSRSFLIYLNRASSSVTKCLVVRNHVLRAKSGTACNKLQVSLTV